MLESNPLMTHSSVKDILAGQFPVGSTVTTKGWIRTRRDSKAGISFLAIYGILYLFYTQNLEDFITPTFLIFYGLLLFAFHKKERKNLLIISGICILFSIICIMIPSYWYSALLILGVAHITYGVVVKE